MDIYESLNIVSKLSFPKIRYTWDDLSINIDKPLFRISICTNQVENYVIGHYENGLKSIRKVIECGKLTSENKEYAKQLLVVLADSTINYHSDTCKNKNKQACKLYKKDVIFKESVIEYASYLPSLISNLISCSFFDLDFGMVKEVCEKCVAQLKVGTKEHSNVIEELQDKFTYYHFFDKMVTKDNALKYWRIAEYINAKIPELHFFELNDGRYLLEVKEELDSINSLRPLIRAVEKGKFWIEQKSFPPFLEFSFKYPNGINGDLIRYIFEEYGTIIMKTPKTCRGRISKKHIVLFEFFSTIPYYITDEQVFLDIFEKYHLPTILYRKRLSATKTPVFQKDFINNLMEVLNSHKKEQERQRAELYSKLVLEERTTPKWKSEALLFSVVSSIYDDAIYQYRTDWLGMQSIDIYIPSLMLGIEYQGAQHYKPVEYFGGEKHFMQQQENDKKKRKLCKQNGVILIEWPYSLDICEENLMECIKHYQPVMMNVIKDT